MRAASASARKPGLCLSRRTLSPLRDEGAVRLLQRHHVADRGERHEVEQAEQIGLGPIAIEAFAAQRARRRDQEQEHHAGGGEMALAGEIVLPVRIDHGKAGGSASSAW